MTLLNKKSGLLGDLDKSLDTRVLMKDYGKDPRVTLAMDMFSYRVVKAVGAYLVCPGGRRRDRVRGRNRRKHATRPGAGVRIAALVRTGNGRRKESNPHRASRASFRPPVRLLQALVVLTEEGLQIAHECIQAS